MTEDLAVVVVAAAPSCRRGQLRPASTPSPIHPRHARSEHIHSHISISISTIVVCTGSSFDGTPLPALIEGASAAPDGRRRPGLHPRLPHPLDLRRHGHRIRIGSSGACWAFLCFCIIRSSSCSCNGSSRAIIGEQRVRARGQQRARRPQCCAVWQRRRRRRGRGR